jgi:hypothetical protein
MVCCYQDGPKSTKNKHNKINNKNAPQHALSAGYNGKYTEETVNVKFLILKIDKNLNWTKNIHKIHA